MISDGQQEVAAWHRFVVFRRNSPQVCHIGICAGFCHVARRSFRWVRRACDLLLPENCLCPDAEAFGTDFICNGLLQLPFHDPQPPSRGHSMDPAKLCPYWPATTCAGPAACGLRPQNIEVDKAWGNTYPCTLRGWLFPPTGVIASPTGYIAATSLPPACHRLPCHLPASVLHEK